MSADDIVVLSRARDLFSADVPVAFSAPAAGTASRPAALMGVAAAAYRDAAAVAAEQITATHAVDARLAAILGQAAADHRRAYAETAAVLEAARADQPLVTNPIAARELLRRRLARLRTQRSHVLAARRRARLRHAALRALRYRTPRARNAATGGRATSAVRAALSRLGLPYVWGAAGPDRFDCSGLVKWAYAQAGVDLHRTTYDQINDGVPVARSQIRPGDLVFPHTGHVQMALGGNLVIEAPYSGAPVRISPLGAAIAIRRPA